MMAEKRYNQIMELLRVDGTVKSEQLRKHCDTSYETIRRDLRHLEKRGMLKRTHGGAMQVEYAQQVNGYMNFQKREMQNLEEKIEVAELAADFVREGQSVALDSGTTASKLADVLAKRFQRLTIVTNSLRIANQLVDNPGFTLILTGGVVRPDEYSLTSDMATLIFSCISSIDVFFLTSCGVSPERGVTYQRPDEIPVQNKMLEGAAKTYLLIDSSKLGMNSLIKMCDLESITQIITDSSVTRDQVEKFKKAGVAIVNPNSPKGTVSA